MAFVTGLLLIDAPASALNNLGSVEERLIGNVGQVKVIRTREGFYPYVSAQAFRYWLRATLENSVSDWKAAPIYRDEKAAYTEANPIMWWDDDLFGYMRAPSDKGAKKKRYEDPEYKKMLPLDVEDGKEKAVTRISPFRVSTLVSIAPVTIVEDQETMSRHEGDPVPYTCQFYRTTLKGLFSLDLHACGTFYYKNRSGFRNLDNIRIKLAKKEGLIEITEEKAYRLPKDNRIRRITSLFEGLALLEGGAKQALHYTDVSPVVVFLAVTKGGNNIFGHIIGANSKGLPEIKVEALNEALAVFKEDILSDVYVGWTKGYLDAEREKLENFITSFKEKNILISHPRYAFQALIEALKKEENYKWLD